jgi:squalene cyclase
MLRYCFLALAFCAVLALIPSRTESGDGSAAPEKVRVAELSPAAEAAINKGLDFLAKKQNADGSWDNSNQVAITALTLMAFMVQGHFPDHEPYGKMLAKGVDFLLQAVRTGDGYMGDSMYGHGLATLALCEAWGESSKSDEIRDAIKQAVALIVRSEHPQGGWRYQPKAQDRDISVTVMQLVALASAKEAGILVPDETITRAMSFVKSCQLSSGGFGYTGPSGPGLGRTGAGTVSMILCGQRDSKEVQRGLEYLRTQGINADDSRWFYYGHYYAVQAMYQSGEKDFQAWYPKIRDALVNKQRKDGSWADLPSPDSYCTPMAILILGVPYRYLPIYQR